MKHIGYFLWWEYKGTNNRCYEFIHKDVNGTGVIHSKDSLLDGLSIDYSNGKECVEYHITQFETNPRKYSIELSNWGYTEAFSNEKE